MFEFVVFWSQLYTVRDILVFCSMAARALTSMGEVVLDQLRAHHSPFSLSGSILEHLEESVWLLGVSKMFSCHFQTIVHSPDGAMSNGLECAKMHTYISSKNKHVTGTLRDWFNMISICQSIMVRIWRAVASMHSENAAIIITDELGLQSWSAGMRRGWQLMHFNQV